MTNETVNFLRTLNRWRRGDTSLRQPSPRVIGQMIDDACDQIERMEQEIESLRDTLCEYKCHDKARADGGWANI
jgi:hypothetical protein